VAGARDLLGLGQHPVIQYYKLAFNRHRLGRLKYVMERSLTKTLARKCRIRGSQVYRRYRAVLATEHGPRRGLQVTVDRDGRRSPLVAPWGGISLARDTTPTVLNDNPPRIWSNRRSELIQRLLADTCELCDSGNKVEVHHIRALKDLNPTGRKQQPEWATRMAARRRKTLSSAAPATRASTTADARHGNHDKHWRAGCHGKRARPVRRGSSEKDQHHWHFVVGLPYFTSGSVGAGR
jgi:hypothetical protein